MEDAETHEDEAEDTGFGWMGTKAAAAYLGITNRTLYRFIDDGDIPAYKLGRVIRVKRADLDAFLEASRVQPGDLAKLYPPRKSAT
jgi:excisionase family DNA binding protein